VEAADEETVEADQLARTLRLDVLLGPRCAWRLVGSGVARDKAQPFAAGVETMPAQTASDAVG